MSRPAYRHPIYFVGMTPAHLSPCDVCKQDKGKYHVARGVDGSRGYLYRQREKGLAHAWCICDSDVCFNLALISDLSEWHE